MPTTDLGFELPSDATRISQFAKILRDFSQTANDVIKALKTGPRGEQGLPGLYAIPADAAVAGYLDSPSSKTGALANAKFAPAPAVKDLQVSVDALGADPGNGVTSLYLPAKSFDLVSGPGTWATVGSRLNMWHCPRNAAPTYLAMSLRLPSHWRRMYVDIEWVNTAANDGGVAWTAGVHEWAVGESVNGTPAGSQAVAQAPAALMMSTLTTVGEAFSVNPAKHTTLRISRNGASASDTLPNAAAVFGVTLRKAG